MTAIILYRSGALFGSTIGYGCCPGAVVLLLLVRCLSWFCCYLCVICLGSVAVGSLLVFFLLLLVRCVSWFVAVDPLCLVVLLLLVRCLSWFCCCWYVVCCGSVLRCWFVVCHGSVAAGSSLLIAYTSNKERI